MKTIEAEEEEKAMKKIENEQTKKLLSKKRNKKVVIYSSIVILITIIIGLFTFGSMTKYTFSLDKYQMLKDKDNALIKSVKEEEIEDIEFLLKNGANANYVNQKGENSIAEAIKIENKSLVKSLLNKESSDIAIGTNKDSLTHIAVDNEQLEIVKELKKFGFDMNVRNKKGETILYHAIRDDHTAIIDYLINEANVDVVGIDDQDNNAIQVALSREEKNVDLIKKLVKLDIDLEKENGIGINTYNSAILSHDMDVVKELIHEGLDLNHIDNETNSALHIYLHTKKNDTHFMNELISAGTDINGFNAEGYSPLYLAITNEKVDLVDELVDKGADINNVTNKGETALELVSGIDNKEIKDIINQYNKKMIKEKEREAIKREKNEKAKIERNKSEEKQPEETESEKESIEKSDQVPGDIVISYTITEDGLVEMNPTRTDINVKVNQKIILEPTLEEGVTERVLFDGTLMEPINPHLIQAINKGTGTLTIIPNGYDWDDSLELKVIIN